ncbi:MAG TPA: hypothetical protein ENJ37_07315 [Deltaproteobacteria bacterium]|nr:hypothetical protein [Deltaproteobacteria bacterium]
MVAGGRGGNGELWLVKLDSTGGVSWQKIYGRTSLATYEGANSVVQTADGGYIVVGYAYYTSSAYDVWVLKLDSSGGVTWQKRYGGTGNDYGHSVVQTTDGGYMVAAQTSSFGAGGSDVWLLKLDSTGRVSWQKTYGGSGNEHGYSVVQTSDGGYAVAGFTASAGAGGYDVWVLKLDSSGAVTWQKAYGGSSDEYGRSVVQTSDGGYVVTGRASSAGAGNADVLVLKLDGTGGLAFNTSSGMSVTDTAVTPADTTVTAAATSAAVTDTAITPADTTVTPADTNATVTTLAP